MVIFRVQSFSSIWTRANLNIWSIFRTTLETRAQIKSHPNIWRTLVTQETAETWNPQRGDQRHKHARPTVLLTQKCSEKHLFDHEEFLNNPMIKKTELQRWNRSHLHTPSCRLRLHLWPPVTVQTSVTVVSHPTQNWILQNFFECIVGSSLWF